MILATRIAGEGSPVVLLHGLFGSARNLTMLARALAAQHRVVSMDLRNHGESPHAPAMDYDTMAADVVETIAAHGLAAAALVGHSMGGQGRHAPRFGLAGAGDPARGGRHRARCPIHRISAASPSAMLRVPPTATRAEADAPTRPGCPRPGGARLPAAQLPPGRRLAHRTGRDRRRPCRGVEAWGETAEHYAGPSLFVTGARSDYVLAGSTARPSSACFRRPASWPSRMPGHWLHAEQPAAFNATVGAFLPEAVIAMRSRSCPARPPTCTGRRAARIVTGSLP